MSRWIDAAATGGLLVLAAPPFIILFPEPPAFGRGAAAMVADVAILAAVGTAWRAEQPRRSRILRRAAILLAITVAATGARILLADAGATVPTADMLPRVFHLQGEDVDDAVLYEVWAELWLACALLLAGALRLIHASHLARPRRRPARVGRPWEPAAQAMPRWNVATVLLWLVGWATLVAAALDGHRTSAFLSSAVHVTGAVAEPQPHPRIRFTTTEGASVEFTQDGFVSRPLGAAVPVAYLPEDPAGSAKADTFWADWSDVLGLLWIGLSFTLFPFYGLRATFRPGRW